MAVESNRYARRLYRTRVCADRSASLSAISDGEMSWDDAPFVPCYDANGNVTRYLDASGRTVAQYVYDAFGGMVAASGPLADVFRFRFSMKYLDAETGLYYYGYRFYSPALRRWLTRDPIEARSSRPSTTHDPDRCYTFRIRTRRDGDGNLVEAYYGKIPLPGSR